MNARRTILILPLLSVLLWSSPATSTWSHDPSQNNVVCDVPGGVSAVLAVGDGEGGAVAVWEDQRDTPSIEVYAQRINASGDCVWAPEGLPVCTLSSCVGRPRIDRDGQGGFVIVWKDDRATPGRSDIYAQRVTSEGLVLWTPQGVRLCTNEIYNEAAMVVGDGNGGLYAVWGEESNKQTGELHAQHAGAVGDTLWGPAGIEISEPGAAVSEFAVAPDGEGGLLVAWTEGSEARAQRFDPDGARSWTPEGAQVTDLPGVSMVWRTVSDGAGGMIVVWWNDAGGDVGLYAQRIDAFGARRWTSTGVAVCQTPGLADIPALASDGARGVYIAWVDERDGSTKNVYAQHLNAAGQPTWATDGIQISVSPDDDRAPNAVADGAGGAVIAWQSGIPWYTDILAQKVDASGVLWASGGVTVSSAPLDQIGVRLAGDGAGGMIGVWEDRRLTMDGNVYAQRVERNGFLGYPAPVLESLIDVPADQGGQILLTWDSSDLDVWPDCAIDSYSIWRRYADEGMRPAENPTFLPGSNGKGAAALEASGWVYVGEVEAFQLGEYSYVVPSFGDSTAAGILWTECMVLAHNTALDDFWMSGTLSGYSVDNLAPGAPLSLAAEALGADVGLSWSASGHHDEDLRRYNVHRSAIPGYEPDASTRVGAAVDTFFVDEDPGAGTWYYRVVAEDIHGNEGQASNEASVNLWAGVDEAGGPQVAALTGASPNPFRSSVAIAFDLPRTAGITLSVYAVDGRRVATLVEGIVEAGHRRVLWGGGDDGGVPLPSGVYFVRLEAGSVTGIHKVVLLR